MEEPSTKQRRFVRQPKSFPGKLLKHRVCKKRNQTNGRKLCIYNYIMYIYIYHYISISFLEASVWNCFVLGVFCNIWWKFMLTTKLALLHFSKNGETTWNFTPFAWVGKHTNWTSRQNGGNNPWKSIVWRYPPPSNILFLVRDPDNKPLFATVSGWGLDPISWAPKNPWKKLKVLAT